MAGDIIKVPDLGGAEGVEVIEIPVSAGDEVAEEDTLLVLESDKASMDLPSPVAGVIGKILVKLGDTVSEGDPIVEMESGSADEAGDDTPEPESDSGETESKDEPQGAEPAAEETEQAKPETEEAADEEPAPESGEEAGTEEEETISLPDLGTEDEVEVIEVAVGAGDEVSEGDALMTLEGDKATMDVPSTRSGRIVKMLVKEGSKVKSGQEVAVMETAGQKPAKSESKKKKDAEEQEADAEEKTGSREKTSAQAPEPETRETGERAVPEGEGETAPKRGGEPALSEPEAPADEVYAGPMVRQFARELGVDLRNIEGSGMKGRIQKEDVQAYVKRALRQQAGGPAAPGEAGIAGIPDQDFSKFGEVEEIPLSKVAKLTAANMTRAWLNVPAVTQFDDADITDLEAFRQSLAKDAEKQGVKVTLPAFLMLACGRMLREHPVVNRSWHSSGEKAIQKHYVHIGMAVDTPRGLMVPVIRDVDTKGIFELAEDIAAMADKARNGKLSAGDMQGGCFSISSLGGIGGKGFTPIVNAPEAAILGVSKASVQPVWNGEEFVPRQMLPLSLTYDHKLVNGADAGRFLTDLVQALGDMRRLLL